MKILLLNYEFPPLGGGAGNATKNIAREMASLGHEVNVVTTLYSDLEPKEVVDGYTVYRLASRRKLKDRSNIFEMLSYVFVAILNIGKIIGSNRPDIVISFFAIPTGIVALYLKLRFGIPYVISLRGGDVPGFLPKNLRMFHLLSSPLTKAIWSNSRSIVANSVGLTELAEKTAHKLSRGVEYIPNGVNLSEFTQNLNIDSKYLELLFVGRLTEQKGVTYILKAIGELVKQDPSIRDVVRLRIVGDGPLMTSLVEESKALSIHDMIDFKGWVSRESLPKVFNESHVLILPSIEEGMPNVILEAISSGLAVIATNIGGNEELVHNNVNGYIYDKQDELPVLIKRIIDDRSLVQKFGNESLKKSKEFSWEITTKKYINLCQKIQ